MSHSRITRTRFAGFAVLFVAVMFFYTVPSEVVASEGDTSPSEADVSAGTASVGVSSAGVSSTWLSEAGFGTFTHFLPDGNSFSAVDKFDVEAVADQLHQIGARYYVFTIYQNSGWFNCPNSEYDAVVGWKPGQRCAQRDLPMELAAALNKRGIRLMLYVTAQTPNRCTAAQRAYKLVEGPADQKIDTDFARKWAKVFQTWSDRYGKQVSGWWVDGSYAWVGFNDEIAGIYSAALKHGNPNAIVAFNPGVKQPEWETSDYTAGEINNPFAETVTERFLRVVSKKTPDLSSGNLLQTQILTFLGKQWGNPECRYTDQQWIDWVKSVISARGAVTIDAAPNWNRQAGPVGVYNEQQFRQLKAIGTALNERR